MHQIFATTQQEEAVLRSALIFNSKEVVTQRNSLLQKGIVALIASNDTPISANDIIKALENSFKIQIAPQQITDALRKITDSADKLVVIDKNGKYRASDTLDKSIKEGSEIESKTDKLLTDLVNRVSNAAHMSISESDKSRLKTNARNALSAFFHHHALSVLEVTQIPSKDDLHNCIETAGKNLPKSLQNGLITALAELIQNPTENDRFLLESWARAFVTAQLLNLDPWQRYFRRTQFDSMSFVLDTDVLLHALVDNAQYSQIYKHIISFLNDCRVKIIVTDATLDEVWKHAEAAMKQYDAERELLLRWDDMMLRGEGNNVFIEDFVKKRRQKEFQDLPFRVYIENFVDIQQRCLLSGILERLIGKNIIQWHFDNENWIMPDDFKALYDDVLDSTEESLRGRKRSMDKNKNVARGDIWLVSEIRRINDIEAKRGDSRKMTFQLTASYRTINGLRKSKALSHYSKYICHPQRLYSLAIETGLLSKHDNRTEYLSLFENPFLLAASKLVKDKLKPILDKGKAVKYVQLERLRLRAVMNTEDVISDYEQYSEPIDTKDRQIEIANKRTQLAEERARKKEEENKTLKQKLLKNKKFENYQNKIQKRSLLKTKKHKRK